MVYKVKEIVLREDRWLDVKGCRIVAVLGEPQMTSIEEDETLAVGWSVKVLLEQP